MFFQNNIWSKNMFWKKHTFFFKTNAFLKKNIRYVLKKTDYTYVLPKCVWLYDAHMIVWCTYICLEKNTKKKSIHMPLKQRKGREMRPPSSHGCIYVCIHMNVEIWVSISTFICIHTYIYMENGTSIEPWVVECPSISRLLKIIGLFCKRAL